MPPKAKYSRDQILECAVALTKEQGIRQVSARTLAMRLGCSTAPIFTYFESMDALVEALMDRIITDFVKRVSVPTDTDPLVSVGVGWLQFAAEEPLLYEAVFLRAHRWSWKWWPIRKVWAEKLVESERYAGLSPKACNSLVGRASIVIHGLGLELWSKRIGRTDLLSLVRELVVPVVDAAMRENWFHDPHQIQGNSSTE
jgi:AcrR family transcriptional regulator